MIDEYSIGLIDSILIWSYLVMVMSPEAESTGDWLNKWLGDGLLIVNDTISVCILVQDDQFKIYCSWSTVHDLLFKIYCSRWLIQDILFMIYSTLEWTGNYKQKRIDDEWLIDILLGKVLLYYEVWIKNEQHLFY